MGRRIAGGKPAKTRRHKSVMSKRRPTSAAGPSRRSTTAARETEIARLSRERDEALEREKATAEVLRIISSSPGELEPVFNAMLENATRICEAKLGNLFLCEGNCLRAVAVHGDSYYADHYRREPMVDVSQNPGTPLDRVIKRKQVIHISDLRLDQSYLDGNRFIVALADTAGARTELVVPMLKEDELIGAIVIYRQMVRPFADKQITLVQNFAAQAVIAIENARLLNELRQRTADLTESLERQMATSEVLRVISSSPGDLEPVFQAMLENATRICGADFGSMSLYEGNYTFRAVAVHGSGAAAEYRRREPVLKLGPGTMVGDIVASREPAHITDIAAKPELAPRLAELGARTIMIVPMLKEQELVGTITIYRYFFQPFTDKQIELLKNFAAQAVIAIENARLLNELRESLEQQTATSNVLEVISRSAFDLQAVFETVAESSVRLCEADRAFIFRFDGELLRMEVAINAPQRLKEFIAQNPIGLDRGSASGRAALERRTIHIPDVMADPEYTYGSQSVEIVGTILAVPILKGDDLLGVMNIYHTEGVKPFTDKQIALVETFADQAAIAIDNVRLLDELRQSLQQQTATADVLKVISRSTFDLRTVLQTLVESAVRLCEGDMAAIARERDGNYHLVARHGFPSAFNEYIETVPMTAGRGSLVGRVLIERNPVQIVDVLADSEFAFRDAQAMGGFRTMLGVPLLREGSFVGTLIINRSTVKPFTRRQIELAQTFADQAVIAIENVRLFETEQQRTRELARSLEDLRTAQDRLVQTQKLASLGQLTAGIAHEIKNPLNFVNNFSAVSVELIDELRGALGSAHLDNKLRGEINEIADTLQGNLDKVVQHGKRADAIVKNMLLHSRQGSGEHRPVDINGLVEESLNLAYHGARAEKQGFEITLERSFDPAAGEADVFPQEITRALLNLISNGFYAATKRKAEANGGDYEPTVTAATKNLGDRVEIRIRDNGTGIPARGEGEAIQPVLYDQACR